jgi:hypothetical protein
MMSALTREDVLRELELLPVWQLRQPLPDVMQAIAAMAIVEVATATPEAIHIEKIAAENNPAEIATQMLSHIASDDGQWLFVLENHALSADEAKLLQNMQRAMRIQCQPSVQADNTLDLVIANNTQLIVALGEAAAQTLLQSTEKLTHLRGQLHPFQTAQLVVTFGLQHLLQHPQDKARTWEDICLAMQALQINKI